jgi:uncharacterized protein (DUF924 family)
MNSSQSYQSVVDFWFVESKPEMWFSKNDDFDKSIKNRFTKLHYQASVGELYHWRSTAQGRLAEIIVLDQFSRNLFRENPNAFATDSLALVLAQEAIACKADDALNATERGFLYMPFMHSESKAIHEESIKVFTRHGNENMLNYAVQHKAIIDRFGRYPHRNEVLGRESSQEEKAFLLQPGSSF